MPSSDAGARSPYATSRLRQSGKNGCREEGIDIRSYFESVASELQKSRETGAELHDLTGAMNDIHDALGVSLVSR